MSGLKPCLLCEGEAKLLRRSGRAGIACPSKWYRERVECKVCGLTTREYKRPGSAFRSWNKRPRPTPVPCDVPELVRYDPNNKTYPYFEMEVDELGEYVRYDQATATIAAKDARIAELEELLERTDRFAKKYLRHMKNTDKRNEALETDNNRLLEALERITDWPNGGKNYGQENIKGFACAVLREVKP